MQIDMITRRRSKARRRTAGGEGRGSKPHVFPAALLPSPQTSPQGVILFILLSMYDYYEVPTWLLGLGP